MFRAANVALALALAAVRQASLASDSADAERWAHSAETLPLEIACRFALPPQPVQNDTGINVLVDLAHECTFQFMWQLPKALRERGLRSIGSQAALDSVLPPGSKCRVRIPVGDRFPFGWIEAPRFNAVLTQQSNPAAQAYLPEEIDALEAFVSQGGGLIVAAGNPGSEEESEAWSMNALLGRFGARASPAEGARRMPALSFADGEAWEIVRRGESGGAECARRLFGKGRVVAVCPASLFRCNERLDSKEDIAKIQDWIAELTAWAAGGAPPAGGATALPMERGGGGPIYPERERRFGAIVVFFARNQTEALLRTVEEDLPAVKKQLFEWLPTLESPDPLFIVLSSGAGGGWAVNAYLPKETGVISLSREGVISVFAHELAHTMAGPANARGEAAGRSPLHNQGEAHAGWWQGKINALMGGKSKEPNRLFEFDKNGDALDLAAPEGENLRQWGKGKDWTKIWWVWQTLEDRYGPAWYPRWKWVQHTRWQDDPQRALSWDETIEDMSIAAGEDLFPFFASIGTTLGKTRMGRIEFQGRTVELPPAKIEIRPCGEPNLGAIGDYLAGLKTD